ncbi:MAG TPA: hypothetical protein VM487_26495 [Phycisphaerae bacterium]|nr:hypothetical protein [Phycisphaerae bacterium]
MIAHRHHLCVHFLALVSALPWPTLFVGARDAPDAPKGTAPPVVLACDPGALVSAAPNERKPVVKGERIGLDATALPIAVQALVVGARFALPGSQDASHLAYANHPSCAFLCRFLV